MFCVPKIYALYATTATTFFLVWMWSAKDGASVPSALGSNPRNRAKQWEKDIHNETFGFQRIYCINLPERTDRADSMSLAATVTNIGMEFVDGVRGEDVSDKVLPPGGEEVHLTAAAKGTWRSHMDALNAVVRENLATALIVEDDIDWDWRIKDQLVEFARGTAALTQPLRGSRVSFADPTFPNPPLESKAAVDIDMSAAPEVLPPLDSPYGDLWEVLWLGHCGTNFPDRETWPLTPTGRAVFPNDQTVPQTQHLRAYNQLTFEYSSGKLEKNYPNHTRVVHHSAGTSCPLAYAVTQRSARRMLFDFGLRLMNGPFDLMLSQYCDGRNGRDYHNCLTVQPALMKHHRPAVSKGVLKEVLPHAKGEEPIEDIDIKVGDAFTNHIRVSTRINLAKMLEGDTTLWDSYLDNIPPRRFNT